MQVFDIHHPLAFVFGLLGNIISTGVYFSPMPTIVEICKKKSTMGFQSLPYVVSLFSALLWLFYAFIKGGNTFLLISINSLGIFIESVYIIIFFIYATPSTKKQTIKGLTVVVGLCLVIFLGTFFGFNGQKRVLVVGWICVGMSVCVFAAPLTIVFQVVRTRSVEYMPLSLSFFLTISAMTWFAYGFSTEDICVTLPNILGFVLGIFQMGLYAYFRKASIPKEKTVKSKVKEHIINITILSNSEVHPVYSGRSSESEDENKITDFDHGGGVVMDEVKASCGMEVVDSPRLDTGVLVMCPV